MASVKSIASTRALPAPTAAPLPDYILQRNAQAGAAGVAIDRQTMTGSRLTTWYVGMAGQWRASEFVRDKCFQFPRNRASDQASKKLDSLKL